MNVSYLNLDALVARRRLLRRHLNRARMTRDLLDGAHEDVRDDRDTQEAPEETDEVEGRAQSYRPPGLVHQRK